MSCCPLHTHSEYSKLDGVARICENADRAVEIGAPALALTDHESIAGHRELAKECKKRDLKPLFGVEAYIGSRQKGVDFKGNERDQDHQLLIALTDEGLRNLYRIVDSGATEDRFHHVNRIHPDTLVSHCKGILATSTCMGGWVPKALMRGDYEPLNRSLE